MPTALMIHAFDATPGAHVILDLEGRVIQLNRDAREHARQPWRDAPQRGDLMVRYVAAPGIFLSNLRRCANGEHVVQELEVPRSRGEISRHSISYRPLLGEEGAVRACLLSALEIERPRPFAQHLHRLQAAELVARGVVHDASNLLGIVSLYLPSILETTREVDEVTGAVTDAVDRLIWLFGGLRRHLSDPPLLPERIELSAFLDRAAPLIRMLAGRRVKVGVTADRALVVCVDETELHRVVVSVVAAARDRMPDGGEIEITATSAAPPSGYPSHQGDVAVLRVRNTPTGARVRPGAERAESDEESDPAPLSLACIREAVRQFGGFLEVGPSDGQMATVTIGLPRMGSQTSSGSVLDGRTLLLILGDDVTRRSLAADLALSGAVVVEASTVVVGIAIADRLASLDGVVVHASAVGHSALAIEASLRVPHPGARVVVVSEDEPSPLDALRRELDRLAPLAVV